MARCCDYCIIEETMVMSWTPGGGAQSRRSMSRRSTASKPYSTYPRWGRLVGFPTAWRASQRCRDAGASPHPGVNGPPHTPFFNNNSNHDNRQ